MEPQQHALARDARVPPRQATVPPLSRPGGRRGRAAGARQPCTRCWAGEQFVQAGPQDQPPSYAAIDGQPHNRLITRLFRAKMVAKLGQDSSLDGYDAIIDLTRTLNSAYRTPAETQRATQEILRSLFPAWLLPAFRAMFARPLPALSCRLNAAVTALTCQWLMGPSRVNDVQLPDGSLALGQGVLVERCRYLEQSGCASVCINSCKVPTQSFFAEDMALPLRMEPNYADFSCQFSFGLPPLPPEADEAFATPCFAQCPSKAQARRQQQQQHCPRVEPPAF